MISNPYSCRTSRREIKTFDKVLNLIAHIALDNSSAILCPIYDPDTNLVIVYGKGETSCSFYEVRQGHLEYLNRHTFGLTPSYSLGFLPKQYCNADDIEILAGFRLCATFIEKISIKVPRLKKEFFQDDIFKPTLDVETPCLSIKAWFNNQEPAFRFIDLNKSKLDPCTSH